MDRTKKILIITYYWPPSGGAGVQRWVKLTKYLSQFGIECHVLTVKPEKSSYQDEDKSLIKDIHPSVKVYKTNTFEIINIYARLFGKKKIPKGGFSNVDHSSLLQKLIIGIRSNFFIPDPRIGWNKYALSKAKEIIQAEQINTIITSSPPHSTQLIGLKLKRWKPNIIKWVSDLRDPWTDIYYYNILYHSRLSHAINLKKEIAVLNSADSIITVSDGLKQIFQFKINSETDIHVLPNGYDPDDFKELPIKQDKSFFSIVYTGTMSDIYDPIVFFRALDKVCRNAEIKIKFTFIGSISSNISSILDEFSFEVELINTVPHEHINRYQKKADLLLLVIPKSSSERGILTGKLFEYLATHNRIINIGPKDGDAAQIISDCEIGQTFNREEDQDIYRFLENSIKEFQQGTKLRVNKKAVEKFSRVNQARLLSKIIK